MGHSAGIVFGALILILLTFSSPALAHSLWLEVADNPPKANKPVKINVGFNEGFEVVEILVKAKPSLNDPVIFGVEGEVGIRALGSPNYAYESEKPLPPGSYLGFVEYEPFVMGHGEGAPKNRYFMSGAAVINLSEVGYEFVTKPLGKSKLEIVLLKNPISLKAGGSLPLQVLYEGKPLPKATVLGDFRGFNPAGSWGLAKAFYCQADKDGKLDFIPAKGGLWIIKVRHAIPNEDKSEAEETVHLYNITFFVAE
jgi:uncharacterized GH25 family protein